MSQAGFSEGEGLIKWLGLSLKWHNILSSVLQPKAQVGSTHKSQISVYSKSCAKHKKTEAKSSLLHQSKSSSDFQSLFWLSDVTPEQEVGPLTQGAVKTK